MKTDLICQLFGLFFGVITTGLVVYNWSGQIYYDLFPEKAPENPYKSILNNSQSLLKENNKNN